MIPEIFKVGPLAVHSFGLLLVLGLVTGWRSLELSLKRAGEDPKLAEPLVFWAGIGGVLGARLLYLISFPEGLRADFFGTIFGGAGFVFYGGLLGGTLAVWIILRRRGLSFIRFADLTAPALAFGYAVGRIGCHLSGDGDYGIASSLPWAVSYSLGVVPTAPGITVHPTPVYETLASLAIGVFLFKLQPALRARAGSLFALYLFLSSSARFLVEEIRIEPVIYSGMTEAQLLSIVLSVLAGLIWIRSKQGVMTS